MAGRGNHGLQMAAPKPVKCGCACVNLKEECGCACVNLKEEDQFLQGEQGCRKI